MSNRVVGLLQQGWNHFPEIMCAGAAAMFGMCMGAYGSYLYTKKDLNNRRYKQYYTIMRSDDPRVAKIHKD